MKIFGRLLTVLIICSLLTQGSLAVDANDLDAGQESDVSIELTRFDVNDTNLELGWKIINNTNDEVWVCDNSSSFIESGFESFLAADSQTLIIRRRLDVPHGGIWRVSPAGTYVRLRPGEILPESLVFDLPVQSRTVYASHGWTEVAEFAGRIALEIGFYDQDLPALIRSILQEAEKYSGSSSSFNNGFDIKEDYFRGLLVRDFLGPLEVFDAIYPDFYGEGKVLIPYSYQALTGEKVLQLLIDNISIPYQGYVQSANQEVNESSVSADFEQENSEPAIELTHFEITDANIELNWKITNYSTEHDIWICDSIDEDSKYGYEVFLAADSQTLLIRRRLDVPSSAIFSQRPYGRYIRIRRGETRQESLVLNLPVQTGLLYASHEQTRVTKCADCIALEIGFYDKYLPAMVRSILQEAEKFGDTNFDSNFAIIKDYFRGVGVREWFGSLEDFDALNPDFYSEGKVLITYSYQTLTGEKVLWTSVDGVSIPYDGYMVSIGQ
jgi:hypothetical protein